MRMHNFARIIRTAVKFSNFPGNSSTYPPDSEEVVRRKHEYAFVEIIFDKGWNFVKWQIDYCLSCDQIKVDWFPSKE